ncbi:LamG domain-containing protein [Lysobacter sp. BMK333-48F3]|uniref:LamG domain-containing protein n=1 Tax=Lysobacter sp. BMK333-48F3 TaxID=2867962 RepID=UPI001C8C9516|nr:LamG domain-containing protein [Lysobacter sp. BMK333-48F3]MBX9399986.1 LamG domain-containing protein [Lysobacter sp. BMK333-48F3]
MNRSSWFLALGLALAPCFAVHAAPPRVTQGLVGEWHLDLSGTTAFDTSGYGRNGTLVGGTASSWGWLNTAGDFSGGKYAQVPNSANLNFGTGSFTLAAWVRMASPSSSSVKTIIDNRASGAGRGYSFTVYNGQHLLLQLNNGTTWDNYVSNGSRTLSPNRWHHVAVAVNRSTSPATISFYIDGYRTTDQQTPRLDNIDNFDGPFLIGGHKDIASYRFSDRIDEVLVYNRSLIPDTAGGIGQIMAPGRTAFQPTYWNDGSTRQRNNNCYNYANNKATNTFAQPGRAAGAMYTSLSCTAVVAAANRDGLEPVAATQINDLSHKNIAALVVAPGYDYHWYRRDANGKWTHKPGGTAATNRDNSGNEILDPRNANRGPYSDFCGFYRVWSDSIEGAGHEQVN